MVTYLDWVDLDLEFVNPLAQLHIQQVLPNSYVPKQNRADSDLTKIIVNPTQVCVHQSHPVKIYSIVFVVHIVQSRVGLISDNTWGQAYASNEVTTSSIMITNFR